MDRTPIAGCLAFGVAEDAGSFERLVGDGADIILCDASVLATVASAGDACGACSEWLSQVRALALERIDLMSSGTLAHLGYFVELMRWAGAQPQTVGTAPPLSSPEVCGATLLGSRVSVIEMMPDARSEYDLEFWLPPLDVNGDIAADFTVPVRRRGYQSELEALVAQCAHFPSIRRVLVWHGFAKLSAARLRKLGEAIRAGIDELGAARSTAAAVVCVADLGDVPDDWYGQVDLVVIAGRPGVGTGITEQIGVLVRDKGVALFVVPEDPVTNAVLRAPDVEEILPFGGKLVVPRSAVLNDRYLRSMLAQAGSGVVLKRRLAGAARLADDQYIPILQDWCRRGFVEEDDAGFFVLRPEMLQPVSLGWGVASENALIARTDTGRTLQLESWWHPFVAFDGGLLSIDDDQFHVSRESGALIFRSTGEGVPVERLPYSSVTINGRVESGRKTMQRSGAAIEVQRSRLDIAARVVGYQDLTDYSSAGLTSSATRLPGEEVSLVGCPAVELSWVPTSGGSMGAHEVGVLVSLFLSISYSGDPHPLRSVAISASDRETCVLFAPDPVFGELVDDLYRNVEGVLDRAFRFAYRLLSSCPCRDGCPRCLDWLKWPMFHATEERVVLSKESALRQMGTWAADAAVVERDIQYKRTGLAPDEASRRYKLERGRVIDLLRDKVRLEIRAPVPLETVPAEGKKFAGLYMGDRIQVVAPLPEAFATEVIAHEYAHDWQMSKADGHFAPVLLAGTWPHDGKLFIEGYAQWVAFKTDDFFGLADGATSISLRADDEYGDGFRVFDKLEKLVGFEGVLDFAANGVVPFNGGILTAEALVTLARQEGLIRP